MHANANTPTNAAYAKLPDFLTIRGTMGNPQPDINKRALFGTVLTGVAGSIKGGGGILQDVGGILTGQPRGATNTATATSTNSSGSKAGGLLEGLGGLLRDSSAGANAQTNRSATNQAPANNLLDGLFGPKKK